MINLKNLSFHLDNLNSIYRCLSEEEKLGLMYSMTHLQNTVDQEILFWGKIEGTVKDYYISFYLRYESIFPEKVFFYCTDDFEFKELRKGNDAKIKMFEREMPLTLFTGIPTFIYTLKKVQMPSRGTRTGGGNEIESSDAEESEEVKSQEEDEGTEQERRRRKKQRDRRRELEEQLNQILILEVERLSYVIRKIDKEAFIIPYNSVKVTQNLQIKFTNFTGFNLLQAVKLSSWVHFRNPRNFNIGKIDNYNPFFLNDFLDSIVSDTPKQMWNIRINDNLSKVSIVNHLYPGFIFYHILNTPFYASLYIGNGIANMDLPFLLP